VVCRACSDVQVSAVGEGRAVVNHTRTSGGVQTLTCNATHLEDEARGRHGEQAAGVKSQRLPCRRVAGQLGVPGRVKHPAHQPPDTTPATP
jgi:hypothetical protein